MNSESYVQSIFCEFLESEPVIAVEYFFEVKEEHVRETGEIPYADDCDTSNKSMFFLEFYRKIALCYKKDLCAEDYLTSSFYWEDSRRGFFFWEMVEDKLEKFIINY